MMRKSKQERWKYGLLSRTGLLCLLLSIPLWTALQLWWYQAGTAAYKPDGPASPVARALLQHSQKQILAYKNKHQQAARHQQDAGNGATQLASSGYNPEWDLMTRLFLVGALANHALRDPALRDEKLIFIDYLIEQTLNEERRFGSAHFLLPYGHGRPLLIQHPAGNQFVDGEIALMLGMRRVVAESAYYKKLHQERLHTIKARMQQGPLLSAESYPDELWLFCNSIALAAMRIGDFLDGSNHQEFFQAWLTQARQSLVDQESGLLISSFRLNGEVLQGPEGSSIWMSLHCLQLIDPDFAEAQYNLARKHLFQKHLGYAWAREWPHYPLKYDKYRQGAMDIDSGLVLPGIDASPASSGLALVAAASFEDQSSLNALYASLRLTGFAYRVEHQMYFPTTGSMGHAVLVYALMQGPLWKRVGAAT